MSEYPYAWYWRSRLPERKGQRCRVTARGAMNSIRVEFQDGYRTITSRFAVRKAGKLRLLLTDKCNRRCSGCCNGQWDLASLPVARSYQGYSEILLTGGEPLLDMELFTRAVAEIRAQTSAPIYVYTAWTKPWIMVEVLQRTNGITLSLHDPADAEYFVELDWILWHLLAYQGKSLRVNIFRAADFHPKRTFCPWKVKADIEWLENCPLPDGEVFMRYMKERSCA